MYLFKGISYISLAVFISTGGGLLHTVAEAGNNTTIMNNTTIRIIKSKKRLNVSLSTNKHTKRLRP